MPETLQTGQTLPGVGFPPLGPSAIRLGTRQPGGWNLLLKGLFQRLLRQFVDIGGYFPVSRDIELDRAYYSHSLMGRHVVRRSLEASSLVVPDSAVQGRFEQNVDSLGDMLDSGELSPAEVLRKMEFMALHMGEVLGSA